MFLGMIENQMRSHIAQFIMYRSYVDNIVIFADEMHFSESISPSSKIHSNHLAIHETEKCQESHVPRNPGGM